MGVRRWDDADNVVVQYEVRRTSVQESASRLVHIAQKQIASVEAKVLMRCWA